MPAITKPYIADTFLCVSAFSAPLREKSKIIFSVLLVPSFASKQCLCVKYSDIIMNIRPDMNMSQNARKKITENYMFYREGMLWNG